MSRGQPPCYDPLVVAHRLADLSVRRTGLLHDAQEKVTRCYRLVARIEQVSGNPVTAPPAIPDNPEEVEHNILALLSDIEAIDQALHDTSEERRQAEKPARGVLPSFFGRQNEIRLAEIEHERRGILKDREDRVAQLQVLAPLLQGSLTLIPWEIQRTLTDINKDLLSYLEPFPASVISGWLDGRWQTWTPGTVLPSAYLRVGAWVEQPIMLAGTLDVQEINDALVGKDLTFSIPAMAPFIGAAKSIVLTCNNHSERLVHRWVQSILLRIAVLLPGKSQFTLLDPATHGQAFSIRPHLPRVTENSPHLIHDLKAVQQRIADIYTQVLFFAKAFHLVPGSTMLDEEPYEFIFAADFPRAYDRHAVEALFQIGNTGPKSGRYLFLIHNKEHLLPRDVEWTMLQNRHLVDVQEGCDGLTGFAFQPDLIPERDKLGDVLRLLRLSTPFEHITLWTDIVDLDEPCWWKGDVREEILCPIGGEGGSLRLWFGTHEGRPGGHALLAADKSQGQTQLYHALLLGLAIRYSPIDLRFYLVEGRDSAEFLIYKDLPHASLVSIHSLPEMMRAVLAELLDECGRRKNLFRQHNVSDFSSYRAAKQPGGSLPRLIVVMDEFQETFEDDREGEARKSLLQIVWDGNTLGIHLLLGSRHFQIPTVEEQSVLLNHFHFRLAMKLPVEEVDSLTGFGPEGKQLIRQCDIPGKIVLNDLVGDDRGNTYGCVSRLPEDSNFVSGRIQHLAERAKIWKLTSSLPRQFLFKGREQPSLWENVPLQMALAHQVAAKPDLLQRLAWGRPYGGGFGVADWRPEERPIGLWIGQDYSVHTQTQLVLRRRPNQHAVLIGEDRTARYGMLAGILASVPVLYSPKDIQILLFDRSPEMMPESTVLPRLCEILLRPLGYPCMHTRDAEKITPTFARLVAQIDERKRDPDVAVTKPSILVILTEPDRLRLPVLRRPPADSAEEANPNVVALQRLLNEGSACGIHILVAATGLKQMGRVIDPRHELGPFGHRVALEMTEDESFMVINTRHAGHLQKYGPQPIRGWYYQTESHSGRLFRPYEGLEMLNDASALAQQLLRARSKKAEEGK